MSANLPNVVVIGSINIDLVAHVPRLPRPGETLAGSSLDTVPGGKGANQAVAASRLGAHVTLVGRVGDDSFAPLLLQSLEKNGVDLRHVQITPEVSSGTALITVEDGGENTITLIPGANARLTPEDVEAAEGALEGATALLLQLETPLPTVVAAAALARKHGVPILLDPAPAPDSPLPETLFPLECITPNQTEAERLCDFPVQSLADAEHAARTLQRRGSRQVVLTLGAQGVLALNAGGEARHFPARVVQVVDTTAAGDAFAGALATALAGGRDWASTIAFAQAAGSLAVTRPGAQPGMPTLEEVRAFLAHPTA